MDFKYSKKIKVMFDFQGNELGSCLIDSDDQSLHLMSDSSESYEDDSDLQSPVDSELEGNC